MFVLTLNKNGLKKLGALAACGIVLAGGVFAVNRHFRADEGAPAAAATGAPEKIETTQDIAAYFTSFGLEVDLTTSTVDKVKIPKKWDDSFSAFNEVIKESNLDLAKYKGKTVEKWVTLCPGRSTGDTKAYCVLLVYKQKPVGAYLLAQPSGEVTGLASAAQTAAPLTEEEQAAAAAFGEGGDAAAAAAGEGGEAQPVEGEIDLADAGEFPIE